jgi:hypothetical protein
MSNSGHITSVVKNTKKDFTDNPNILVRKGIYQLFACSNKKIVVKEWLKNAPVAVLLYR